MYSSNHFISKIMFILRIFALGDPSSFWLIKLSQSNRTLQLLQDRSMDNFVWYFYITPPF